jgi:integrase
LQAIKGHRFENIFTVALFTGMREGETLGLTWDCVDFDKGTVTINKQLQREKIKGGRYILAPTKNGKARTITPAPWVMQILRSHRAKQAEQRLKLGEVWEDSGLVFTNELGQHLAIHTVYKDFKAVVASIGCPSVRFHDLRHSYAVASIRSGDDIKTIQGNLGHATAAFTLDIYGHVTDQMKQESAARMESYIKGVLGL